MNTTTALVLSGGGARTAYQTGALRALSEILPQAKTPFRIVSGTSAGAINGAYLAANADRWTEACAELSEVWLGLTLDDVYKTDGLSLSGIAMAWISRTVLAGKAGTRQRANYLLSTKPLSDLLEKRIPFARIDQHIQSGDLRAVSFEAVQYFTGASLAFYAADSEVQDWSRANRGGERAKLGVCHVMASSSIPMFFPPVQIGLHHYGDGTLRQTAPLSPAIHLGAQRILSIGIRHIQEPSSPGVVDKSPSFAEIAGEILNALFLDSIDSDVERLRRINETVAKFRGDRRQEHLGLLREIPILQLRPSRNLTEMVPPILHHFPPTLRYFLKGIGVSDRESQGQELISYLGFINEAVKPMLELGYNDTLQRKSEILDFMKDAP